MHAVGPHFKACRCQNIAAPPFTPRWQLLACSAQDKTWKSESPWTKGRSHDAGEEAQNGEAAIDEVDKVRILRLHIQRRENGATGRYGRCIEAIHQRDEADDAQNPNDLINCRDGATYVDATVPKDDERDLQSQCTLSLESYYLGIVEPCMFGQAQ